MARENALDVAVEYRTPRAVGERGNRRGGRSADAGQSRQKRCSAGKHAAEARNDDARRRVQQMCTPVISQPAPVFEDPFDRRRRQRVDIGKGRKETLVIGNDRRHLRLLQHDLRQPDAIRVPRVLPREVLAAGTAVPGDEARREGLHLSVIPTACIPTAASFRTK